MRFNGKPMFDLNAGMMSSGQAARYLGWSRNKFSYYVITGKIKYTKRGYYKIFTKDDVDSLRETVENIFTYQKTA